MTAATPAQTDKWGLLVFDVATHSSFRSRSKRKDFLVPVKFGCRWPVDGSMRIVRSSLGDEGGGPVRWTKPHVHCISCPGATWPVECCLSGRASELFSFTGPETELRVFPANATATAFPPAQSVAGVTLLFAPSFKIELATRPGAPDRWNSSRP